MSKIKEKIQQKFRDRDSDSSKLKITVELSDAGLFSYASIWAAALNQLFPDECHKDYRNEVLDCVLHRTGLPKQTSDGIRLQLNTAIESNDYLSMEALADTILQEETLKDDRLPLIQDMLIMCVNKGVYDARSRTLIKHIAFVLKLNWSRLEHAEEKVVQLLREQDDGDAEEGRAESEARNKKRRRNRLLLIGAAAVGGGALIGITGGLAAPLVAAGAGAVFGGAGAAVIGTAAGAAVLGSLFGVAGAGLTGYKMRKRVGALSQFEFVPLTGQSSQLHCTLAVTGWIHHDENDFLLPWSRLDHSKEQYVLKWEAKYLKEMGDAMDYMFSFAKAVAIQEGLKLTVLSGLLTAIAWPAALVSASSVIDNPWSVCISRSEEAGKMLADVLISRQQGTRPITLIGYSLGARVIFYCLQEMSKRQKGVEGIIEDVYLLGAPVSGNKKDWSGLSRVVSGKIINGYSKSDWLLKFLFRSASVTKTVAGLGPVRWEDRRICNMDLTPLVSGHRDYLYCIDDILCTVGLPLRAPIVAKKPLQQLEGPSELEDSIELAAEVTEMNDEQEPQDSSGVQHAEKTDERDSKNDLEIQHSEAAAATTTTTTTTTTAAAAAAAADDDDDDDDAEDSLGFEDLTLSIGKRGTKGNIVQPPDVL